MMRSGRAQAYQLQPQDRPAHARRRYAVELHSKLRKIPLRNDNIEIPDLLGAAAKTDCRLYVRASYVDVLQQEAVDAVRFIGADSTDPYRARLFCVDKILKFAPADLPVQRATKFEFVITSTARSASARSSPRARTGESSDQVNKESEATMLGLN
jgi:hypothetical protein